MGLYGAYIFSRNSGQWDQSLNNMTSDSDYIKTLFVFGELSPTEHGRVFDHSLSVDKSPADTVYCSLVYTKIAQIHLVGIDIF